MSNLVDESWKRICSWLKSSAPAMLEGMEAGASTDEIKDLAEVIRLELPDDLCRFLSHVNGAEESGIFPSRDDFDEMASEPMPIDQIVADWKTQNELLEGGDFADLETEPDEGVAEDWWNPGWIPFATNGGGDFFCIDMAPTASGTPGQVISHSHESGERKKLADSLAVYLQQLAADLESGEIRYDEDCGLVAELDDD